MTHLLSDGGPTFMYPLLILLLTSVFLIVRGIKNNTTKNLNLLKSIGLFALVFGFLGFTIGLIDALDRIVEIKGDIATPVLAGGFKIGILPPTFGMFTFLVGRAGIILLTGLKKEN
ncbi:hypothetical protein [Polaribacter uvawellassae]|uniref:hypothetical protein n=1 Tax=Polaribacter uvawellassae TaxID=3133495 RepID=UPI00321B8702